MPSNKEKGQKMFFCIHLNGVCLCACMSHVDFELQSQSSFVMEHPTPHKSL